MCELVETRVRSPDVALLDDEPRPVETDQRDTRQRLYRSVDGPDDRPPVHRGAVVLHDRLAEPAFRRVLVSEGPRRVLVWRLRLAKRMGVENRVGRVESGDRVGVRPRPRIGPDRRPARRSRPCVYFATSIARLSRMTITFT